MKPQPLSRVSVNDGLLLTAEMWQTAHNYHQQKQNIFYQSFYTQGIVSGLGVTVTQPPKDIPATYRDFRWLKIQPGLAIDQEGNTIIVPEPIEFRVASVLKEDPLMIYIVASYVDPEQLNNNGDQAIITETFRIDEKVTPPEGSEIELCRILLPAQADKLVKDYLANAVNVFSPDIYELDSRYRQQVQWKQPKKINIGHVVDENSLVQTIEENFASLLNSCRSLYPQVNTEQNLQRINLATYLSAGRDLFEQVYEDNLTLVYLTYKQVENLTVKEIEILKQWRKFGTTIFVEYNTDSTGVGDLKGVQEQLKSILKDLDRTSSYLAQDIDNYQQELGYIEDLLEQEMNEVITTGEELAKKLDINVKNNGTIGRLHRLRHQPFLFGDFPIVEGKQIEIFNWQNLILVVGKLSNSWSLQGGLSRSREEIRSCQEIGINILDFAWQFHNLQSLNHK